VKGVVAKVCKKFRPLPGSRVADTKEHPRAGQVSKGLPRKGIVRIARRSECLQQDPKVNRAHGCRSISKPVNFPAHLHPPSQNVVYTQCHETCSRTATCHHLPLRMYSMQDNNYGGKKRRFDCMAMDAENKNQGVLTLRIAAWIVATTHIPISSQHPCASAGVNLKEHRMDGGRRGHPICTLFERARKRILHALLHAEQKVLPRPPKPRVTHEGGRVPDVSSKTRLTVEGGIIQDAG
jgi:hypothetical protein